MTAADLKRPVIDHGVFSWREKVIHLVFVHEGHAFSWHPIDSRKFPIN